VVGVVCSLLASDEGTVVTGVFAPPACADRSTCTTVFSCFSPLPPAPKLCVQPVAQTLRFYRHLLTRYPRPQFAGIVMCRQILSRHLRHFLSCSAGSVLKRFHKYNLHKLTIECYFDEKSIDRYKKKSQVYQTFNETNQRFSRVRLDKFSLKIYHATIVTSRLDLAY